jgi:hypothetical protein
MARTREMGPRARMRHLPLIVGAVLLVQTFVMAVLITRSELARSDAAFLQQCHDAGYDAAKCRFFLTATGRMNNAAAAQLIIEAAKPK